MNVLEKAQGCFAGLIAGDNLGALVEFQSPDIVKSLYPKGFKDLINRGGTFDLRAGQPTDDGELAITLARTLIRDKEFNYTNVLNAYKDWSESKPFDIGTTTSNALWHDEYNPESISNGALMRIAPIGIYGVNKDLDIVGALAIADAECTHENDIVFEVNSIYARAISLAIRSDIAPKDLFQQMVDWATIPKVRETLIQAKTKAPTNMFKGTCLVGIQNAMYHLYHTGDIVKALDITIRKGGDADTHSAILGALFGAVYGLKSLPKQWIDSITTCEAIVGTTSKPRPSQYWSKDVLSLAEQLISL